MSLIDDAVSFVHFSYVAVFMCFVEKMTMAFDISRSKQNLIIC